MADQLAYVILTPYTLLKSRTGGIYSAKDKETKGDRAYHQECRDERQPAREDRPERATDCHGRDCFIASSCHGRDWFLYHRRGISKRNDAGQWLSWSHYELDDPARRMAVAAGGSPHNAVLARDDADRHARADRVGVSRIATQDEGDRVANRTDELHTRECELRPLGEC